MKNNPMNVPGAAPGYEEVCSVHIGETVIPPL